MGDHGGGLQELAPREALRLLATVAMGRVAFTARALPAILAVSHLVDGADVIIRADGRATITPASVSEPQSIVAYQADLINPDSRSGWSVTVVGPARQVVSPREAARYREILRSWPAAGASDQVIAIRADLVTGFRIAPIRAPGQDAACRAAT